MAYKKIQFIGYSIDTGPGVDKKTGEEEYLGLTNARHDIEARCLLMRRAMETAREHIGDKPSQDKILKVFMAPEFFFRGRRGAYTMDEVQHALAELQALAAEGQWDNWLIVFGTLLGEWDETGDEDTKRGINFALIQEGGVAAAGSNGARIVMKELKSNIDFITGVANPGGILWGEIEHMDPGPSGPGREAQRLNYDGAGLFDACGISWAADICLDHLEGRLLNSPQLPGSRQVQVQLVPSAGASIEPDNIIAQDGGYAFNVDGLNGSEVTLVENRFPWDPIVPGAVIDVSDADIDLPTDPPEAVGIDRIYARGAGKVVVYKPVETPEERFVAGEIVELHWAAGQGVTLDFSLIYDEQGHYVTMLCQLDCPEVPRATNRYFVPLDLETTARDGDKVVFRVGKGAGAEGYHASCNCTIETETFNFSGVAFLFDLRAPGSGKPPAKLPLTNW